MPCELPHDSDYPSLPILQNSSPIEVFNTARVQLLMLALRADFYSARMYGYTRAR